MKNTNEVTASGNNLVSSIIMSSADIQKIRNDYLSPEIVAQTPTELFTDLEYKFKTSKQFRKTGQVSNDSAKYYNDKEERFNYAEIVKDFPSLKNKIKIVDTSGKDSGIVILSFNFGLRDYRKIYFDMNQAKIDLNQSDGKKIKS